MLGPDAGETGLGEGGQDQPVEQIPVQLHRAGSERPPIDPPAGLQPGLGILPQTFGRPSRIDDHPAHLRGLDLAAEGVGILASLEGPTGRALIR